MTEPTASNVTSVVELRRYLLHAGQRDVLIELFEREFIESQEAVGAHVLGTFQDVDSPDSFVWLRSFANMEARASALEAFYSGRVWRKHCQTANATMIDSDNVHLLRVVGMPPRFPPDRGLATCRKSSDTMFVVDIYRPVDRDLVARHMRLVRDERVIAVFATAEMPNNFPRLPVRENDKIFAVLRRFEREERPASPEGLPTPDETLRLRPTARSLLS